MRGRGGRAGLTGEGEELVANEDGRVVLRLVEGILPPFPQEPLHTGDGGGGGGRAGIQETRRWAVVGRSSRVQKQRRLCGRSWLWDAQTRSAWREGPASGCNRLRVCGVCACVRVHLMQCVLGVTVLRDAVPNRPSPLESGSHVGRCGRGCHSEKVEPEAAQAWIHWAQMAR